jgi:flavin reductase (DIM6/NTAB) family NADH-FMN oxidoreductase RutF
MTANGVTSVSLSPPLALACIGHDRNTHRLIRSSGRFGISILASDQVEAARHYAQPPERRDISARFDFETLGKAPVLKGALTAMDCRVVSAHEAGDHTIFVAEVECLHVTDGDPLLWYAGAFGDLCRREPDGAGKDQVGGLSSGG